MAVFRCVHGARRVAGFGVCPRYASTYDGEKVREGTVTALKTNDIGPDDSREYLQATEVQQCVVPASAFVSKWRASVRDESAGTDCHAVGDDAREVRVWLGEAAAAWAGINGHGKSMTSSQVVLSLRRAGSAVSSHRSR